LMEFGDSAIDAGSEAEVVRVDDESGRHRWFGHRCSDAAIYYRRAKEQQTQTNKKNEMRDSSTTQLKVRP
jgi:hypothetical protein